MRHRRDRHDRNASLAHERGELDDDAVDARVRGDEEHVARARARQVEHRSSVGGVTLEQRVEQVCGGEVAAEGEVAHPHQIDGQQPARTSCHLVHRDAGVPGAEHVEYASGAQLLGDQLDRGVDLWELGGHDAVDGLVGDAGVVVGHGGFREEGEGGFDDLLRAPAGEGGAQGLVGTGLAGRRVDEVAEVPVGVTDDAG